MRRWTVALAVAAMACGGGQEAGSQDVEAAQEQAERAVAAVLAGDRETQAASVCDVLRSGIVEEVFGVDAASVTYRPGSKFIPHPLCTASWDAPDQAEREAACQEEVMAHTQRRTQAMLAGETFDEPMPECLQSTRGTSVSLTVTDEAFDSPAAAVASLESAVATLEEGITVTVQGKEHTTQVDFDDWMDGVGDQAAWAPRPRELLVASDGVRFAVTVQGAGDETACKAKAIEVAQRVAAQL